MYGRFVFLPTLKTLDINVNSGSGLAEIRARPKGFLAFLLTLFGLGKIYNYLVNTEGWEETTTSAIEEVRTYVPWSHVSVCVFKVSKPLALLIAGIMALVMSLPVMAFQVMVGLPVAVLGGVFI